MKLGWPASFTLHIVILFSGLLFFSRSIESLEAGRYIPVEIVTLGEETNIRAAQKKEDAALEDTPDTLMRNVEDIQPQNMGTDVINPVQSTAHQSSDVQNDNLSQDHNDTKFDESETLKTAPRFDLDKMSALIDQTRSDQPSNTQQYALASEHVQYEFARTGRDGAGLQTGLSMSEVDALRARMYQCWRVSADARNAEDLIVRVRVQLFPDGTVQQVDLLDRAQISTANDPFLQIAAERALRAVSKCAPYDFLPQEKYGSWKDMELSFRPDR